MKKELNWAVLGCGVIANEMAQALEHMGKHLRGRQPHIREGGRICGEVRCAEGVQ